LPSNLDREGDGGVEDRRGRDGAGDAEMGWRRRVALDRIAEMIAASQGVDAESWAGMVAVSRPRLDRADV
jgi:hypothetical protein